MHYKKPNLAYTFIEVNVKKARDVGGGQVSRMVTPDAFMAELQSVAGSDGVNVTDIHSNLPPSTPAVNDTKFINNSFFMTLTGNGDNVLGGKPNKAQLDVMKAWGATVTTDRKAWDADIDVARRIATGHKPSSPENETFARNYAFD